MQASLFQQPASPKEKEKERTPWAPAPLAPAPSAVRASDAQRQTSTSARPNFTSAPVIDPAPFRQFRKYTRVDLPKSVTANRESTLIDSALSLGRSFRVAWGPNGEIIHLGSLYGEPAPTKSDVLAVSKFKTLSTSKPDTSASSTTVQTLQLQLSHTPIYLDPSGTPYPVPHPELRFSHFCASLSPLDRSPEAQLWRLGHALFDEIDDFAQPEEATGDILQRLTEIRRKDLLEKWLEDAVRAEVEDDLRDVAGSSSKDSGAQRVFTLLSGHQVERACQAALEAKDIRLATIVAQAGGDDSFREDLFLQLSKWREYRVDSHISNAYRRIYELLCGNVGVSEGGSRTDKVDKTDDIRVSEGLDWKRAFGVHLWYGTFDTPLATTVQRYEKATTTKESAPPLPLYLEKPATKDPNSIPWAASKSIPTDPLFELIKLFTSSTHPLEQALLPRNFGPSPLDYRLPWHLYVLFSRVLRRRDFEDRIEVEEEDAEEGMEGNSPRADMVTEGYASQLELQGLWQWAAFVLLHLELPELRVKAIRELLARNVAAIDQDAFEFLTTTLKIPDTWIYAAQAFTEKYNGDIFAEYKLLLAAKMPVEAHEIVVNFLAPEAVVRNDLVLLRRLLEPFDPRLVADWEAGGKIFADYVDCVEELQSGATGHRLSALLLELIHTVPTLTERRREDGGKESLKLLNVCVAEMQSRLTAISSSLNQHSSAIRPSTLQEADRVVWLQAANSNFLTHSIATACA
ncbi:hypothetical protein MNV49_006097 [Pseudohyphozyma bogoriensis]|nr:hypothetical protein MNV49_006097 [Pseudohyphozyma bogoriensis]